VGRQRDRPPRRRSQQPPRPARVRSAVSASAIRHPPTRPTASGA
jgi:hypothetical protein